MPFRLKKVHLQNFATVRNSSIELPEYGMVLVRGITEVARGKLESSGSGKTALGEAICRTCFGVEGRFSDYGHFSNDHTGNKETLVEVEGTLDSKPIAIKSGFKHADLSPTGEGLAYRLGDGAWSSRGHLVDTRKEIASILGVSKDVASWTVYVDGDELKFSSLGQAALVDLVLASLNQPPWLEYAERANKRHTKTKAEMGVHEDNLTKTKVELNKAYAASDEAKKAYREAKVFYDKAVAKSEAKVAEVQALIDANVVKEEKFVNKKKELNRTIKKHEEEHAAAFAKFETRRLEVKSDMAEARRKHDELVDNRSDARSEFKRIEAKLAELEDLPEVCPTCRQKWDHTHDKKGTKNLERALKEAKEFLASKTKLVDENQTLINLLSAKIDKIDRDVSEQNRASTEDLSEQYEGWDRKLRVLLRDREELKEELARAGRVDSRDMEMAKHWRDRCAATVEGLEDELRDVNTKFTESRKQTAISAYLRTAFGPTGIPNMVLQEAIVPLNENSRLISARMTGNSIAVQFSTTKELVSGKTRSELIIKTDNKFGSKRVRGNSKGEGGLTDLIIAETIAEMSNISARVAYRWYDEVLRNPDETMRRNFFSYVADLAKRKKMLCFVVDHGQEAANHADYVLVAHKTTKGTTYYWE